MRKSLSYLTAELLCVCACCGCAQPAHHGVARKDAAGTMVASSAFDFPVSPTPGQVALNWESLPSPAGIDRALGREAASAGHRILTAEQAQCRAASCAVQGNLLAAEQHMVCATYHDKRGNITPGGALLSNLLAARSVYERNEAAGNALELFYRLAEAELQRGVLRRSLEETDQALADYRQLQQKGLPLADDDSALHRQRLELLGKQVQLETQAHQAEGQLGRLLAVPCEPQSPLSPIADLSLSVAAVDADAAVAQGLALRGDLCMLRVLCQNLNQETLPAFRAAMQQVGGPLSSSAPPALRHLLKKNDPSQLACEQQTARLKCCLVLTDQTRAAEVEIRQAAREVVGKLRQAALARQKWASWQQRVEDLRAKRDAGREVTPFERQCRAIEGPGSGKRRRCRGGDLEGRRSQVEAGARRSGLRVRPPLATRMQLVLRA